MVTVMKSRASDVKVFFSERVDFALYATRASRATIFTLHFHESCIAISLHRLQILRRFAP
jgi:hypothetical protein